MVYCPTILNLCMTNFLIHDRPFWQEAQQNISNSSYCIDFVVFTGKASAKITGLKPLNTLTLLQVF